MVKEAIATGATTEEAYEKACAMLGVDPADAEFEVLETEEKKRFGLFGGRPAKVRAFIRSTPADAAAEYLRNVLSGMGLGDVNIEIREEEAGAELVLTGENIGFIIGHRGETLEFPPVSCVSRCKPCGRVLLSHYAGRGQLPRKAQGNA